ncbi:MAG: 50S ribosomal protein L24 [Candidatus Omnitrophica bacterium CG11_big_fil_rev_8_21_14_0_20_43_6]|nr:MAG: 50S ribosomal protein L24 [Candidatus Omnitrophica bacterium CG11_big_fil_rev_8_21_14_0_20_43_6]
MQKIKKNDVVQIAKGKDKGKQGKVISIIEDGSRAIVEGLNLSKKHKRQSRQDQKGGIISIEMPISISNLMVFCKHCSKPTRVGSMVLKDGTKTRMCKACQEAL